MGTSTIPYAFGEEFVLKSIRNQPSLLLPSKKKSFIMSKGPAHPENFVTPKLPLRAPNLKISPVIKAARWGALLFGIYYGASRYNSLAKAEIEIQKNENELKRKFHEDQAAKKHIFDTNEMNKLHADIVGPK